MSERETLLALAARCEAATGADRELDVRIGWELDGDGYSDADVQYVVGNKHAAAVTPFIASLDAAMTLAPDGCFIAAMGEIAADGLPGACLCISTDPVREVWGVARTEGSRVQRLARAVTAAACAPVRRVWHDHPTHD